jgi:ubiquinone/menaquinone biosynthesis C-methylase UbiE|tara:strand:- start:26322 stop:27014 length:693 start_codon:yes stop_codon:yes gene_type:complete
MNILKKNNWNKSYENKDNFVFYPNEEIIRFISKYIRKKTGLDSFINIDKKNPKILDFGCGIGRHVKFLDDYKLDAYGFDLSEEAIYYAHQYFKKLNLDHLQKKIIVSDITNLPYESKYFNYMLSHGVLDSMSYEIAKKGIKELHRVMDSKGIIFFDLISTLDTSFKKGNNMDQLVENDHENGTIQSYYNLNKINNLLNDKFTIIELYENSRIDHINNSLLNRFNVVAQKI